MDHLTGDGSRNRVFATMVDNLLALVAVPIGARFPGVPDELRFLLVVLLYLSYFAVQEAMWSKTLGKKWFRLKVVRQNGDPIGWWEAFVRTVLRVIEVNPLLLGALPGGIVVLASPTKQRIGDMVAKTLVVREDWVMEGTADPPSAPEDVEDLPEPDMTPDSRYEPWKESG